MSNPTFKSNQLVSQISTGDIVQEQRNQVFFLKQHGDNKAQLIEGHSISNNKHIVEQIESKTTQL